MALSFALALLAAPQAQATLPDTVPIAMTRGGVRIEVSEKPKPGALEVQTAYGVLYTPRDPVAIVMESPRRDTWRKELEANPELSLAPTIERFRADGRIAELLEMMPVLEARLHEVELSRQAEARRDELLDATRALAHWGEALDPLPGSLSRSERIEELWKRAKKAKGQHALLPGARLLGEITAGGAGYGDHQLPISALRDGMRSKNPYLRRVAFQISGKQLVYDGGQNSLILIASLDDTDVVARDGAADGIVRVWPEQAREYWIDTVLHWTDEQRSRAAWHLVQHLPDEAASPLVGTVAAAEAKSRRFDVGDLTLTISTAKRRPSRIFFDGSVNAPGTPRFGAPVNPDCTGGMTVSGGASPGVTPGLDGGYVPRALTNGSSAKVTKVSPALTEALQRALDRLADDRVERDVADWIVWYEKRLAEELVQRP